MVLGLTRARPRLDGRGALIMPRSSAATSRAALSGDWLTERGAIRCAATCDVSGAFPGFAQRGGRLMGAQLHISDAYLLVDEGHGHGFGLPIQWLDGAAVVPGSGQQHGALRLSYRDGAAARHFTITPRAALLSLRTTRSAAQLRAMLLDHGLPDRDEDRAPVLAAIHVPWHEAGGFEAENVIWTGPVSAPLREGGRAVACRVWLTTRSLLWSSGVGDGLYRVPLKGLCDVITGQDEARQGVPAVFLAYLDREVGRINLPFLFDRHMPERNLRERGAFLVSLRSRGIPLGLPAPLIQPWRISVHRVGSLADWTRPDATSASDLSTEPNDDVSNETIDETISRQAADDVILAEFPEPAGTDDVPPIDPVAVDDYALATEWVEETGDERQANPSGMDAPPLPALVRVRAYEAAALAVLSEAMQAIRERIDGVTLRQLIEPMPSPAMQSAAVAELIDLTAIGQIDPGEAQVRQTKLAALAEAGWRLRSLVELRDAGHITNADLARKRTEISSDLSARLFPVSDRRGESV